MGRIVKRWDQASGQGPPPLRAHGSPLRLPAWGIRQGLGAGLTGKVCYNYGWGCGAAPPWVSVILEVGLKGWSMSFRNPVIGEMTDA